MAALHCPPGLVSQRSQTIAPAMAHYSAPRAHPIPQGALAPSVHRRSSRKHLCAASPALPPTPAVLAATPASDASMLPDSREEAIAQACAAVAANLPAADRKGGGKKKAAAAAAAAAPGFAGASVKLSVEIPVADESNAAAISLAKDLVAGLPAPWNSQFTVVVASGAAAGPGVVPLSQLESSPDLVGSCLVIAAPKTDDIGELEAALGRWRGPAAIVLNAEWAPAGGEDDAGFPSEHIAFALSFNQVYCFMPLLIKAFVVSSQEGVVFRCAAAPGKGGKKAATSGFGGPGGSEIGYTGDVASPWRVFVQQDGKMEAVARMARRPSSTEIEVCFYNASAAGSPLTKGAKFLKGLMGKEK